MPRKVRCADAFVGTGHGSARYPEKEAPSQYCM